MRVTFDVTGTGRGSWSASRPGCGHLPGHPGQLLGVAAGPGFQRLNERRELSADSHAAELGDVGEGVVGQLQPARLSGLDVDSGQHDSGLGAAGQAAPLPAEHRRRS
jgi:hypothetical protein